MFSLGTQESRWILVGLAFLMAATRSHHGMTAFSLPDASLAVFFLAGLYLGSAWILPSLLAEAVLIDYLAIVHFGVDGYCISPAYGFLIPTYAVMWLGGRWSARRRRFGFPLQIGAALIVSTSVAFLISNGSFYLFSERFASVAWADYAHWVVEFYFPYLIAALGYSGLAIGLERVFIRVGRPGAGSLSSRRTSEARHR